MTISRANLWMARAVVLGATGCAANAAPPPTAPAAVEEAGAKMHLVLTAQEPTNVGRELIDADLEMWLRDEAGPVLYASSAHDDHGCSPNVTVSFGIAPAVDGRYRIGSDVELYIEAQCGAQGEMRSWRAVTGEMSVGASARGYRVHIERAQMRPSSGENQARGAFVVSGMGTYSY